MWHNAGYIISAYLVAVVVIAGMVGWIVLDGRLQRRRLADLEARGVRRRSRRGTP